MKIYTETLRKLIRYMDPEDVELFDVWLAKGLDIMPVRVILDIPEGTVCRYALRVVTEIPGEWDLADDRTLLYPGVLLALIREHETAKVHTKTPGSMDLTVGNVPVMGTGFSFGYIEDNILQVEDLLDPETTVLERDAGYRLPVIHDRMGNFRFCIIPATEDGKDISSGERQRIKHKFRALRDSRFTPLDTRLDNIEARVNTVQECLDLINDVLPGLLEEIKGKETK